MSKLEFNANQEPTLGIELELGIVDGDTMDLANRATDVLDRLPEDVKPFAKPELMQSCVEVITDVCRTVDDAEKDLRHKLMAVEKVTDELNLRLWWASTHPDSRWQDQVVTENERYHGLVELLQEMARRLITFGLHVHVGVDSGDKAVMICDRMMQHLPTLLALSTSSPYWERRDTGLYSHRSKIMEGLPTAGLPTLMRNWSEYVWLVNHMEETGFINSIREIWWDIRPHHNFGTVEVRVCDMPGNLDHVLGLAAMVQCLVEALSDEIDNGAYQHDCHPMMVRQNKWRAARFGNGAQLVNSYTFEVQSVSRIASWLIDRLRPVSEKLGCRHWLESVQDIADGPSWPDRQRQILRETNDRSEIIRRLSNESRLSK